MTQPYCEGHFSPKFSTIHAMPFVGFMHDYYYSKLNCQVTDPVELIRLYPKCSSLSLVAVQYSRANDGKFRISDGHCCVDDQI